MDFSQFARLQRRRRDNLPKEVHKVKQETATVLLTQMVTLVPIDTGTAVSNFQMDVNSPADTIIPAHYPGRYRSTADANISATIALGKAVIDSSRPGDDLYLTNHVEYIVDLDNGSSTQAPAGFTQTALLVARRVIRNAKVVKPR